MVLRCIWFLALPGGQDAADASMVPDCLEFQSGHMTLRRAGQYHHNRVFNNGNYCMTMGFPPPWPSGRDMRRDVPSVVVGTIVHNGVPKLDNSFES